VNCVDEFHFALHVGAALLMGMCIGLERQYRQHPAGLRTNALVCMGAALFISITRLVEKDGNTDPTRIASYIVSGIGFLGGGVILREGFTVKGMNTAATLWCTAAVGSLAGAGFPLHALIGTCMVLGIHLGLRPIGRWIDVRLKQAPNVETIYRLRVGCSEADETLVRTIVMRHVGSQPRMSVQGISTHEAETPGQAIIVADIFSLDRQDRTMHDIMSRLNIESSVKSVSWTKA
jgi:putative Mg2+ transporter-C (MgtC) family protein